MDKHQYTRFCFLSICVGSIALVFAISRCSISFFDYSLQKLEFSFPESELRRSFYNAGDENRAVDSRDVVSQQILSVRSRNATTVIVKGVASDATARVLHGNRSYPLEDVTPVNSPNITEAEQCDRDCIKAALEKLGVKI
ncbi:hypothetical protein F2Q70_00032368 [Brassica cretica]|uniref:Uncharacterized protein n=1 Tax=Brassica cretica TaxID=69181 RepID=A0A8S9FG59_BRACR|nr:hypothetical protein F2Q70_00032368 [Brassica cretica]